MTKTKTIVKELNAWCEETGQFDRCDQMEWLMKSYPDIFVNAECTDMWLKLLWGEIKNE